MRFLLDENFPLGLLRALQADGLTADHIITLGLRGASDSRIRVVSRVRQSRVLKERIEVWRKAARALVQTSQAERRFELTDAAELLPWQDPSDH